MSNLALPSLHWSIALINRYPLFLYQLKSVKEKLAMLGDHEVVKKVLRIIMLTYEDTTLQIHQSPDFTRLFFVAFYRRGSPYYAILCKTNGHNTTRLQRRNPRNDYNMSSRLLIINLRMSSSRMLSLRLKHELVSINSSDEKLFSFSC